MREREKRRGGEKTFIIVEPLPTRPNTPFQ